MKRTVLREGWWILDAGAPGAHDAVDVDRFSAAQPSENEGWLPTRAPAVVQEVLLAAGRLDGAVLEHGRAHSCAWVAERDWVYWCRFERPAIEGEAHVVFKGLDTVVDIHLNGELLERHSSMFLPARVRVTGKLRQANDIVLYFHSPYKELRRIEHAMPERLRGKLPAGAFLRKAPGDFNSHGGSVPYFTPIGLFDDVEIVAAGDAEILDLDVEAVLDADLARARLTLDLACLCPAADAEAPVATVRLFDDAGAAVVEAAEAPGAWTAGADGIMRRRLVLDVDGPRLWWPRGYGPQPLYRLTVSVAVRGVVADEVTRTVGFRTIRCEGDLRFRVNGRVIRLWGSCLTPMWGLSHRWTRERALTILDHAERAHMNALRIWGPGQPYDDELYEETDRRGILVWQDFPTSGAALPDTAEHVSMLLREAEHLIKRLKHHPSLLLWCGGNESIYMADLFSADRTGRIGHDIFHRAFGDLCARLDPSRHYHPNSPSGGPYANSADVCDTHGSRASRSYLPGEDYAAFFSENIRTFAPELKSLRRFIPPAELWPEGTTTLAPYGASKPLPPAWMARAINYMEAKTGPVERFYDATDPASAVYRLNAAAGHDLRLLLNRSRRGRPFHEAHGARRTNGHLIWKLDTAWPQIYCAFVDYYLEVGLPYYAVRRAYAPVHVSIDVQDRVYVWAVNDAPQDLSCELEVTVLDLETERVTHSLVVPAAVPSGESKILADLDGLGQFRLTSVLHARLVDGQGAGLASDFEYPKAERNLLFPDACLALSAAPDGALVVATDRFARCVELSGDEDGDAFGWYFGDDYFDLMPGESRIIPVHGGHRKGVITARAHYATTEARIPYSR